MRCGPNGFFRSSFCWFVILRKRSAVAESVNVNVVCVVVCVWLCELFFPAIRGVLIAVFKIHPLLARFSRLFFPKRRAGF